MTKIILFHSALGLTPSTHTFAQSLRDSGHEVETPDLFDGSVFDTLDEGVRKRDEIGIPALAARAMNSVSTSEKRVVFAGFSMGAASAQMLAASHAGAVGCVLMHAALPLQVLGLASWPESVAVQFHSCRDDPWVDAGVVSSLEDQIGTFQPYWYDGAAHLFADHNGGEYDAVLVGTMLRRVREFVSKL